MGCCDNQMTKNEYDKLFAGECPECGGAVGAGGDSIELDDCSYSPLLCEKCGYCPCDLSC